jgi:hypothetical protein
MADQKMFHENDHKLDEMLDAMLSAYSSADPRPGLETRILAGVKEQAANSTSRWRFRWTWAVAALATAALVMMAIYVSRIQTRPVEPQVAIRPQHQQMAMPDLAEKSLPLPKATASHPSTRRQRTTARLLRPSANQVIAIRQDVFPSRSPLSEQEKLLLRYLTRTPREELIAQSRPDPPDEMDDSDSNDNRPQNLTQIPQRSSNTK